jgi:hypothetical protein
MVDVCHPLSLGESIVIQSNDPHTNPKNLNLDEKEAEEKATNTD